MASLAIPGEFQPRRGKARLRLGVPADLLTVHGRIRVTLLDLSETGARLHYEGHVINDGVLEWLGYEAFGAVVRRADNEIGLRFDEPIGRACVLDTREALPAIQHSEDDIERFAREWVRGRDGQRVSAHVSGLRAEVLQQRAVASEIRAAQRARASTMKSWLHAARPFLVGGVTVGLLAGYWNNFFHLF
jgi:hypothetical protein